MIFKIFPQLRSVGQIGAETLEGRKKASFYAVANSFRLIYAKIHHYSIREPHRSNMQFL